MDITSCTQTEPRANAVTSTKNTCCGYSSPWSAIGNVSPWLTYQAVSDEGVQPLRSATPNSTNRQQFHHYLQESPAAGRQSKPLDRLSNNLGLLGHIPLQGPVLPSPTKKSSLIQNPKNFSDSKTVTLELWPPLRLQSKEEQNSLRVYDTNWHKIKCDWKKIRLNSAVGKPGCFWGERGSAGVATETGRWEEMPKEWSREVPRGGHEIFF